MAQIMRPPWYHKHIRRTETEQLLTKTGVKGAYLVRESESLTNTKVLSFLTENGVLHYKIVKSEDGKWSLETAKDVQQQLFESIEHLISYYEIKRDQLPLPLTLAVSEEGASLESDQSSHDTDDEDDGDVSDDQSSESNVTKFFLQQMDILKGKSADANFEEALESYIRNGLTHDLHKVEMGATKPPRLNKVVTTELQKSLDAFSKKLDFLLELFDVGENDTRSKRRSCLVQSAHQAKGSTAYSADFEGIVNQLSVCKSHIGSIETKTYKVLKDYSGRSQEEALMGHQETSQVIPNIERPKSPLSRHRQGICQFFSACKGNSKTKICISLNMKEGKIAFLKNPEDYQDASNTEDQESIAQLLKDKSTKTSLGITIGKKTTTYNFEDFKSRELFCHMVERMKNMHSHSRNGALNQLSVFIGSWNMGNAQPPENLSSWFKCVGNGKEKPEGETVENPYDIVAIGTQESGIHEKEWIAKIKYFLKKLFNIDYDLIGRGSLWDIRLVVFVKPAHAGKVNMVKQSVVKTGLANALGNKGAVGISFYFGSTSFCFVNAHMQARVERVAKRNRNFHDILQSLNLGQQGVFDISNHFHHLFWFGDLNYRVQSLEIVKVIKLVMVNDLDTLLKHDQLLQEKAAGNAFFGFDEEKITFRPTYRFKAGSHNMYIWLKKKPGANVTNVPSWPDRILWKTFPEVFIQNIAYGSTEDIETSDHAPVFAAFDVGILSQSEDISCHIKSGQNTVIEFLHVEAKIRTSCQTRFLLYFCSTCLEGHLESKLNSISDWRDRRHSQKDDAVHSYPAWKTDDIPKLIPALSNQGYLEDQHIQIAIKGEDGHESYGEFVLSVKRLIRGGIEEVTSTLTHLGDESGEIRLMVRATVNQPSQKNVDMVVKNVSDLRSIGESLENASVASVDSSSCTTENVDLDQRRRTMHNSTLSGNYEIVSNFTNEKEHEATFSAADFYFPKKASADRDSGSAAPPVPPKKRLSRQLSTPISTQQPDSTSEIIWIEDPRMSKSTQHLQQRSEIDDQERPPPVPRRASSVYAAITSQQSDTAPKPKPRSLRSLLKNSPTSVEDWLQLINLHQYHDRLVAAGWDDLDYLDFTQDDLLDAGVHQKEHIELLLKSAELLKNKALKHQS
ncbi:phosphatidylinositol 3,4,5-trisphosphate 5-phosphatase 2A-like isoform X1 [Rhopilema esculentum]|uniref:phosphatidylinositol 3,4,5-trisphosphate 5-phosphatase 2A-like isoform X1 n=2 Tax=Rhopilema esculentum TaxID=499914 RepID=UPI0031D1F03C